MAPDEFAVVAAGVGAGAALAYVALRLRVAWTEQPRTEQKTWVLPKQPTARREQAEIAYDDSVRRVLFALRG